MNKELPNTPEQQKEHIPNKEEVKSLFEELLRNVESEGEFKTERKVEDEKGLYLWTITIVVKGQEGYTEYEYTRKGRYEKGEKHGKIQSSTTSIHRASYDSDDFPTGGNIVAEYIDGDWKLLSHIR